MLIVAAMPLHAQTAAIESTLEARKVLRGADGSESFASADVAKPGDCTEFARFLKFMEDYDNVWCKVTCPERLSVSGPPALNGETNTYRDVVPFARKVVEEFPDRVLWGTDWPHPNLKDHMPDDGVLVDQIPKFATTPGLRQKLLVDNPMRLYWDR